MPGIFFRGDGTGPGNTQDLPESRYSKSIDPRGYRADPGLVDAVNVALLLSQPLLLTGEPGTGKTQLAAAIAAELNFGDVLRFDTKSTSTAKDLFYTMDAIGRFQSAQIGDVRPVASYITYSALGKAILLGNEKQNVEALLPPGFEHPGVPRRSVVLIDEVDKAPRDFPNDILAELEEMSFRIPELSTKVTATARYRPVLVITSNSEKHLPDAFLRRCIYYDIPFPDPTRLAQILAARLSYLVSETSPAIGTALELFELLRNAGLKKRPATAELISWMMALHDLAPNSDDPLAEQPTRALETLSALVKNKEDQQRAFSTVTSWIQRRQENQKV